MRISLTACDAVSARSALCGGLPPPAFSAHKQRELKQKCVRDALWDRLRGRHPSRRDTGCEKGPLPHFSTTYFKDAASCTLSCHGAQIIVLSRASQLTTAIGIAHGSQDQLLIYIWFTCETQSSPSLDEERTYDAKKEDI